MIRLCGILLIILFPYDHIAFASQRNKRRMGWPRCVMSTYLHEHVQVHAGAVFPSCRPFLYENHFETSTIITNKVGLENYTGF